MTVQKLVKTWALPDRTQDRHQLTLRLSYDLYAKFFAMKEVYPNRAVNDMINDILKIGIDEVIQALPTYTMDDREAYELAELSGSSPESILGTKTGPSVQFQTAYARILGLKSETDSGIEDVL